MLEQLALPLHRERAHRLHGLLALGSSGRKAPHPGKQPDRLVVHQDSGGLSRELEDLRAGEIAIILQVGRRLEAARLGRHVSRLVLVDHVALARLLHRGGARHLELSEGGHHLLVGAEAARHIAERAAPKVHLDAVVLEQLALPLHRDSGQRRLPTARDRLDEQL